MKRYVVGFMFDTAGKHVLLIVKRRPAWQAGKLNGVGGKIEPGESPVHALVREFEEETGLDTRIQDWGELCILTNEELGYRVHFYSAFNNLVRQAKSITDEEVVMVRIEEEFSLLVQNGDVIRNLSWLVPLARDPDIGLPVRIEDHGTNG